MTNLERPILRQRRQTVEHQKQRNSLENGMRKTIHGLQEAVDAV